MPEPAPEPEPAPAESDTDRAIRALTALVGQLVAAHQAPQPMINVAAPVIHMPPPPEVRVHVDAPAVNVEPTEVVVNLPRQAGTKVLRRLPDGGFSVTENEPEVVNG